MKNCIVKYPSNKSVLFASVNAVIHGMPQDPNGYLTENFKKYFIMNLPNR